MTCSVIQVHEKVKKVYLYNGNKKEFFAEYRLSGNTLSSLLKLHKKKKDIFKRVCVCYGMRRFSLVRDITLFVNILGLSDRCMLSCIKVEEDLPKDKLLSILRLNAFRWQRVVTPTYVLEPNITVRRR